LNKSKSYFGKDLAWWREHTQGLLDPSTLAFAKSTREHFFYKK
jgi:hypothetical protein